MTKKTKKENTENKQKLERAPEVGESTNKLLKRAEEKEYIYQRPNSLHIPQEIVDYYKEFGWALKWKRMMIEGREDTANLNAALSEGYEFVNSDELVEAGYSFYTAGKNVTELNNDHIRVNELTLMRIPLAALDARREALNKLNHGNHARVDNALKRAGDKKYNNVKSHQSDLVFKR